MTTFIGRLEANTARIARRSGPAFWLVVACAAPVEPVDSSPSTAPSAPRSSPASVPSASSSAPEIGGISERLWETALSGDPIDLETLALSVGALELYERTNDPRFGETALRALPHARDAELAWLFLARAFSRASPSSGKFGEALVESLGRGDDFGERLAPDDRVELVATLQSIAQASERTEEDRSLALSALHRLHARGITNAGPVPQSMER